MLAVTLSLQAVVINDTTLGGPTWNRPLAGVPPVGLSGVGTAVPYDVTAFTVDANGSYTFLSTGTTPVNWDNYAILYQTNFNAASPLTNVLVSNDDNPGIGLAGFTISLTSGPNYFFVESGFGNADAGAYSLSITGPGNITLGSASEVPEPATAGLFALGGAALLLARKLRRQ